MSTFVSSQAVQLREVLKTVRALEWFLPGMHNGMSLQIAGRRERLPTRFAAVGSTGFPRRSLRHFLGQFLEFQLELSSDFSIFHNDASPWWLRRRLFRVWVA